MERKEWTEEETKELILLYEENEFLWKTNHPDYRNREKKDRMFNELSKSFKCTAKEVQRKLHNLRNQVSQEMKKMRNKKSGAGTDDIYTSKWRFFSSLQFLIPTLMAKPSQSNIIEQRLDCDDGSDPRELNTEATQETETAKNNNEESSSKKRRKITEADHDNLFREAVEIMRKPKDEFDRFGEYVALELRSLRSDYYRSRLKSEIRKVIMLIADEDDARHWSHPSSSSSNTPSPAMPEASIVADNTSSNQEMKQVSQIFHEYFDNYRY